MKASRHLCQKMILGLFFTSSSITFSQDLYTQTGSDITWNQIINNNMIPIGSNSNNGITGSQIDVNNSHPELSGGAYGNRPFDKNIRIHTVGNSGVKPADFSKWSRWYQEDGNTQVFRMFKGEYNVRNTRKNSARIESFSDFQFREGAGWQEWSARYTIVKPIFAAIMQVKDVGAGWASVIKMDYDGSIVYTQPGKKNITLARNMAGKSFDLRIRDDGYTTEVYFNGEFIGKHNDGKRSKDTQFRWGMYVHSNHIAREDGMIFVTGAGVNRNDDVDTNDKPTVSFSQPVTNVIRLNENYDDFGVRATALDSDGSIDKVDLYINDELIRSEIGAPYEWGSTNNTFPNELTGLTAGSYVVKLIAYDNEGATATITKDLIITEQGVSIFSPVHDAYTEGQNGMNDELLRIENNNRTSYLSFDVSSIESEIERATLSLTVMNDEGEGTIRVYNGSGLWAETNINTSNAPAKAEELSSLSGVFRNETTYEFDVLSMKPVNGVVSFVLVMDAGGNDVSFASKDQTQMTKPFLNIKERGAITSVNFDLDYQERVEIFPNPAYETLNLSKKVNWTITTLEGKDILKGDNMRINITNLPKGIYLLVSELGAERVIIK